jgi:outer membrane immunogenic protein
LQLGYNWQFNRSVVLGIEGDIQWTGQKGSTSFGCPGVSCNAGMTAIAVAAAPVNVGDYSQKLTWLATIRPRLGYTVTPTILAYVTGGVAFGHIKTDGTISGFTAAGLPTSASFGSSTTKTGWTVGGGVEGQIWGRWTAKLEYLYVDLGHVDNTALLPLNSTPLRAEFSSKITDHILRAGLNYRF